MKRFFLIWLLFGLFFCLSHNSFALQSVPKIAYLEGGPYWKFKALYSQIQKEFSELPSTKQATFPESLNYSAGWDLTKCNQMAGEIANEKDVALVITMGEMATKCMVEKSQGNIVIFALEVFDPLSSGLINADGAPIRDNLVIFGLPPKIERDLKVFRKNIEFYRLGVIYYQDMPESLSNRFRNISVEDNYQVIFSNIKDQDGYIDYFQSLDQIIDKIDAFYLTPLYGLSLEQVSNFIAKLNQNKIPNYSSEGVTLVSKGALLTSSAEKISDRENPYARLYALQMDKILKGVAPKELKISFEPTSEVTFNVDTAKQIEQDLPLELLMHASKISAEGDLVVGDQMDLPEAISTALDRNPVLAAAKEEKIAAKARYKQSIGELLPHLSFSSSYFRLDEELARSLMGILERDNVAESFTARQILFNYPLTMNVLIANTSLDIAEKQVETVALDVVAKVRIGFINVLLAQDVVKINAENLKLIEENLEVANSRYELGVGERTDVIRWKSEWEKAKMALTTANNALRIAKVRFNEALNRDQDTKVELSPEYFSKENFEKDFARFDKFAKTEESVALFRKYLVKIGVEDSPELKQAELKVEAAKREKQAALGSFFPTLGVGGFYSIGSSQTNTAPVDDSWVGGVVLTIPLIEGFKRPFKYSEASAKLRKKEKEYEFERQRVELNIREAMYNSFTSFVNVEHASQRSELAKENLQIVADKYREGLVPIIDLLDGQKNALDSEITSIDARFLFFSDMARLVRSLSITFIHRDSPEMEQWYKKLEEYIETEKGRD